MDARTRFNSLREGPATPADLADLWAGLRPVTVAEVLGSWRGGDFATGHPASQLLTSLGWHGKRFDGPRDAHPLICRDADGSLRSETAAAGGGLASLWPIEVDGEVTATMVYDALPVFDHFKRVDDDALLGLMDGKLAPLFGTAERYWFWLEREPQR